MKTFMQIVAMVGDPPGFDRLSHKCITHSISKRMMSFEPYALEGFLTICSFWAAYVLFNPPSNFAAFPKAFAIAERMQGQEGAWATFALIGALTKLFGLICALVPELVGFSFVLRCMGLIVSGIFWLVMGTSAVLGNPDTLMGFPGLLMGVSALWVLIRFPIAPTDKP